MSLRTKCALLILAFEATLCITLTLTARYIGGYFQDAAESFQATNASLGRISRMRALARYQLMQLVQFVNHPTERQECQKRSAELQEAGAGVAEDVRATIGEGAAAALLARLGATLRETEAFLAQASTADGDPRANPKSHLELDAHLGLLEGDLMHRAEACIDEAFLGQRRAIMFLWTNAAVGVVLAVAGLVLVRRWVLEPIGELTRSADEIGRGNLDHRARVASRDEFGRLAGAVNTMSADLARLERQMISRERLAAMGELIAYVAHNIRNPLAGIQAAVEASRRELAPDSAAWQHQDAILAAIEKFHAWLRHLEHTCSPLEIQIEATALNTMVDNVVAVFRPMAERRSVRVDAQVNGAADVVQVDPRHFEHALAAVVGNAIEAAGEGGRVMIATETAASRGEWCLSISDSGPGIPAELADRIFEPTFSTKAGGRGLGLMMARKIVEMHGGRISAATGPGGGAQFRIQMPVRPPLGAAHG